MITFKKVLVTIRDLPTTIFIHLVIGLLGGTKKNEQGEFRLDSKTKKPIEFHGLLDYLLDGVKAIGKGISNFIGNHKQAITLAFWASFFAASGVALALFYWPVVLTIVADYSFYGWSIAKIAGADTLSQLGLASSLAFAATSTLTYISATIINIVMAIIDSCCPPSQINDSNSSNNEEHMNQSPNETRRLLGGKQKLYKESGSSTPKNPPSKENESTSSAHNIHRLHHATKRLNSEIDVLQGNAASMSANPLFPS
ncbi:MAG: hypothetical protein QM652_12600 [Legionella sp.]|uniref:hypothetical protein n=1 Tax=Legionella sp. TaxID=459 RepID=UPI0039E44234